MEDDRIFIVRTKIAKIEKVDQNDLENSIIGGMKMAYTLYAEDSAPEGDIPGLYLTERDTRVFRSIADNEKQLVTLADLKVGQEVEIQYFYPITPVYLAIEMTILHDPDK